MSEVVNHIQETYELPRRLTEQDFADATRTRILLAEQKAMGNRGVHREHRQREKRIPPLRTNPRVRKHWVRGIVRMWQRHQ